MSSFLLVAALLPAAVLCVYIYKKDRAEKEPPGLLALLFFLGVLICFPAGWIELMLDGILPDGETSNLVTLADYASHFIKNLFFVGLVEEGLKWIVLFFATRRNKNFNSLFDGIIYAVFVSLGFAAFENIAYVFSSGLHTAVMRALTAVPGHMFFAVIMGLQYSWWHAQTNALRLEKDLYNRQVLQSPPVYRPGKKLALSIVLPTLFHGAYDFCCTISQSYLWIIIFYLLLIGLYVYSFQSVKKISRVDADDLTVATWLVAQKHPEFKAAIDQWTAQAQTATYSGATVPGVGVPAAAQTPVTAGVRTNIAGAAYSSPYAAPAGQPYSPAGQNNVPAGQSATYVRSDVAPTGQPAASAPNAPVSRAHTVITSGAASRLVVNCGDPSVSGFTVFNMPDGSRYSGNFKDGAADGFGTYYLPDGRQVTGYWSGGRLC